MAFRPFIKVRLTPDMQVSPKHINQVQDRVDTAFGQLVGKDVLDRTFLQRVLLVPTGVNFVNHGLGRPVKGYNIVRRIPWDLRVGDASGVASGITAMPFDRVLPLVASATGTVAMEVF